ncbi:hypothetical protein K3556_09960 [Aliiroseovarius sp. M344]|uniref:hypothetical protein n=1 Tax=Aliiroseovarius sp. M344 TaxID=2867010 RepID=UPI0021AD8CA0|nr:hypothetical protein [Aliiroseovarius sp. M344]UWQ13284.1 hypothetical protein K3556_09960 [Aliiroseovarius sp. M344]
MPFDIHTAPDSNPYETISNFLSQLKSFLSDLFRAPENFGLTYSYDIQMTILSAFDKETKSSFKILPGQIRDAQPEQLHEHGLTGHSLHAKMTGINFIAKEVRKQAVKAIKYLLSLVNSVLGSIAAIAGAAGAIKEIKDLFENTTEFVAAE